MVALAGPASATASMSAPNPDVEFTTEKDAHDMSEFGSDALAYYDNSGEVAYINGDTQGETPVSFYVTHIEHDEVIEIEDDEGEVVGTSLDASEWTSDADIDVTDTTTTGDVEAVSIDASGVADGETVTATFDEFTIDSDELRKFAQVAADVEQLDDAATVDIVVEDAEGDTVTITSNADADADDEAVLANSEGDSQATQVQLGELDGADALDDLEAVHVEVSDADAALTLTMLDLEDHSPVVFGETAEDVSEEDEDEEEYEYSDVTQPNDAVDVTDLSTLDSAFDDAVLHNMQVDTVVGADNAVEERFTADDYDSDPVFDYLTDIHYKFDLPTDQYDLTLHNVEIVDDPVADGDRYSFVGLAYGVDDTDFSDIDYTDQSTVYGDEDEQVTLDSTPDADSVFSISYELELTEDEWEDMQSSSAVMGPTGESGDGFGNLPVIGGLIAAIAGFYARYIRG